MTVLWKVLVLALAVYAIQLQRKLLYLTDAAYSLAHHASFSSVSTGTASLRDTVWGGEEIAALTNFMYLVIGLAVLAIGYDIVMRIRADAAREAAASPGGPPAAPPPASPPAVEPPASPPPPAPPAAP